MEREKAVHTRASLSKHFQASKMSRVVFFKDGGAQRVMLCSLHPDLLPVSTVREGSEPTTKRPPSETHFTVFDVEAGGWRKFKIENIISLEAMS